jgi:hypothetical protein
MEKDTRETSMKLPTIKCPSGMEVSLAAFLLKLTSLKTGQAQRRSINRESSGVGVQNIGTPSLNHQKEERHERRSFQR